MATERDLALRALNNSATFNATRRGVAYGSGMGAVTPADAGAASRQQARADFVRWLTAAHPRLVLHLLEKIAPGKAPAASGLGQSASDLQPVTVTQQTIQATQQAATSSPSLIDNIISAASSILPAYLANQQQKQILNAQLTLAQQGKPPLTTGQYSPTVQVGLSDATIQKIGTEAQAQAKKTFSNPWVLGGIAVVAGLVLYKFLGR